MSKEKNLSHEAAIEKLQDLASDARFGMLCTNLGSVPFNSCPMTLQKVDDNGNMWFFSGKDSEHNADIKNDSRVQLIYANTGDDEYLSIYGKAEITHDKAKIDELWSPLVKAWFPEGKDDPNLSVIKINPETGYYWDSESSKMVTFFKMLSAAATGSRVDMSSSGELNL